jgi:hypothetical protein
MRRLVCILIATATLLAPTSAAAADGLAVSVDRAQIETKLGHRFSFRTTIMNPGPAAARGYVAHLNVLSYDSGVYVDPEDWSGERTRYLPVIAPGRSRTIMWRMQAVNAGHFAVYVALVPPTGVAQPPTTGRAIAVVVAQRTTLNSEGILPLVVGVPAVLSFAWLGLRLRRRRYSSASPGADPATSS